MNTSPENRTKRRGPARDAESRREEILAAATQLFGEHGFSETMTQDLADRLGVGKGTIYRHFPSKGELFLAAADRVMRSLTAEVEASIAGIGDGLERVARGVLAFLTFFAERPEYVELLIQERAQFKDRTRPTYIEHREERGRKWRQVYADMKAEGRIRDLDPEQINDVVANLIYGTMFTNYFAGPGKPVAEQARDILEVVFRGILSDSERARLAEIDPLEPTAGRPE